ncbi:helix-turn-helix transcriptional regulator [Auraticoccus monumenti]|uniref:Helix-turn-helix domain-containing protein n=1 Tax=Auraticoccus monumenti TaxID=675864 RepID=A0A1G6YXF2_9ACTN|nr:helix-turn-helix transcriptional regulator [Auraticoccus monumenti]SDD95020.1 Helix-turn-helix domain-containing protein [Auraticoccus monumenti]
MPSDRAALGAFLRSRRDRLTPVDAGIEAFPGPRRVPGLRKEELAVAAGLSPDYYSRLEQGRQANVSAQVLEALARTLRLDTVERAHLHDLAAPGRPRRQGPVEAPQQPGPGLLRLMADLEHVPVLLLGRRGEVLAHNTLLAAVLGRGFAHGASFPRYLVLDPLARERILNWDEFAPASVASLRRETGRRPHDHRLTELVAELVAADAEVARWWEDQAVRDHAPLTKLVRHPTAGDLTFAIESVSAAQEPDQTLVVYTCPPDSPTAQLLPILASWESQPVSPR